MLKDLNGLQGCASSDIVALHLRITPGRSIVHLRSLSLSANKIRGLMKKMFAKYLSVS